MVAKGFWIANVTITKNSDYADYQKLAPRAFEKFGARFLARGGANQALEGRSTPQRTVVIEFPSYQSALDCYHSEEYGKAREARQGASVVDIVIVEGL
ncbi:DUF1330 domain-containing protein [uncultured Marinobacter sp.]|uniref:DUF1330 domain-containing protein n=1 Tax=uncultured Marinobacter sp. TaxID=187379 RepID=UPI0025F17AB5|nr:DUF1330 domain-containing protein [uncultured Marinobacter sp.]